MPPTMNDSNFAEVTVQRISVSFVYTIRFKKFANAADMVSDIENSFQKYVFDQYIDCDSLGQDLVELRQNSRLVQEFTNKPIGVSTASKDERAMDIECAETIKDEECVPMNGYLELLFTDVAEISQAKEENSVLAAIKDAIESGDLKPSNADVRGLQYFGQRQEKGAFAVQAGIISSSILQNSEKESVAKSGVSALGGAFIGACSLAVALALFAGNRRRKHARFERNNRGALTSLRLSKGDYDLYEVNPEKDVDALENTSHTGSPERGIKDSQFPLPLPVLTFGETQNDPEEMQYHTQDVHHCNSALCQHCSGSRENVRFIDSSEWYDDVEIDSPNLRIHDENSMRTYNMPNTVIL